jgi:Trk K+ transport system NAD-binding subunit
LYGWLYVLAMLREFRGTLVALAVALGLGTVLYAVTPAPDGSTTTIGMALYGAWMAMLAQPLWTPPPTWYLMVLGALYPIVGFVVVGEGIVRFALLMISRREGEKEWMNVMASTHRGHVVLCGLGHLGFRVLEQLTQSGVEVVAIEANEHGRFVALSKELGAPVLIRDMKEDQALIDAGVERARAIIIATNDDMANLEVAMDARRMNPHIRVTMRLFDQQIAAKLSGIIVDAAYSASALAAPYVAALSLATNVTPGATIGGAPYVTTEIVVGGGSAWIGKRYAEVEQAHAMRVLARTPEGGTLEAPPRVDAVVGLSDALVLSCRASDVAPIVRASEGPA